MTGLLNYALEQAGLPRHAPIAVTGLKHPLSLLEDPSTRFVVGSVGREEFVRSVKRKHGLDLSHKRFLSPTWAWGWTRNLEVAWDPTNLALELWAPEGLGPDGRFIECSTALNIERERCWLTDSKGDWQTTWPQARGLQLDRTRYTSVAGILPRRGHRSGIGPVAS